LFESSQSRDYVTECAFINDWIGYLYSLRVVLGDLHSGTEVDGHSAAADTTLLLGKERVSSDHWTVGFCIIQDSHPTLPSTTNLSEDNGKRNSLKNEKLDSASDLVDEGIGEETGTPEKSRYKKTHSSKEKFLFHFRIG